jgi:hypothetical protein
LDSEQAFSIQFSGIDERSAKELMAQPDLPQHIRSFVVQFENDMTQAEFDNPISYCVAFVRTTSNSKTIAEKVIQFVPPGTDAATEINRVFLKENEKTKFRPRAQLRPSTIKSRRTGRTGICLIERPGNRCHDGPSLLARERGSRQVVAI